MAILAMCSTIRESKMKGFLAFLVGLMALGSAGMADTDGPEAEAVLAGGCFWCEHDFCQLPGVVKVVSGYSGGRSRQPRTYENYHDVSTNQTPHTEVVEVTYDTTKLSGLSGKTSGQQPA